MQILLLTETLAAGGAETFVVRLANALVERGHALTLAVMHGERVHPALLDRIDPQVRVERLLLPAKRWLFRADTALRRLGIDLPVLHFIQKRWLKRIVDRERPQVIHSHLLKADRLASELCRADCSLRHVVTMHGEYALFLGGQSDPQVLDVARRAAGIIANADAVVVISSEQRDYFKARYGLAPPRLQLIYNGYEPTKTGDPVRKRSALGLPEGKFLFGMVSRGIADKGWAYAIDAFRKLDRDDAALILVGEGPYLDSLMESDLPEGVVLVGFSSSPLDYIKEFDVGLLPSVYAAESLPTVVTEYLCCAKPVIATDIGEIGAMIRASDGQLAGQLLDFSSGVIDLSEFAEAMRRIIDDPELRREQARRARGAFAKFDLDECVRRYELLYQGSKA